jgi:4-carboxymuconolactone decarboxylase
VNIRIPPIEPGTRPELAAAEAKITAERGRVSLLYQVLLNSPAIANGWEQLLTAVRNKSSLPADLREMVILRVAVLNRAVYEFDAHVPHAQKAGVSDAKIAALRDDTNVEAFTAQEQCVLRLTDAMTREIDVPDALYRSVKQYFNDQHMVDLLVTIASYNMVSRFLVAAQIGH